MDFGDFAARMKAARTQKEADAKASEPVYDHSESYRIRAKMLGVLIRDARHNAARTLEDCARLLSVAPEAIEAWEYGEDSPSLPQLELLAYYCNVPVSHFWGMAVTDQDRDPQADQQQQYLDLRNRLIGALLKHARETLGLSSEQVAEAAHLEPQTLEWYELGEVAIPMHELTVLSSIVKKNMDYFVETSSYVGDLLRQRELWKQFMTLEDDVRAFAANPLNIGFLKIAMMFGKMPTEALRQIAEGMLDITH